MSAVVVGYVPSPEGRAALDTGISEARLRGARLVVVNTTRGDALVDDRYLAGDGLAALQAERDTLHEARTQEAAAFEERAAALQADLDAKAARLAELETELAALRVPTSASSRRRSAS